MSARVTFACYTSGRDAVHGAYLSIPESDLRFLDNENLSCSACEKKIEKPNFYVTTCVQMLIAQRQLKLDVLCSACVYPIQGAIDNVRRKAKEKARPDKEEETSVDPGCSS